MASLRDALLERDRPVFLFGTVPAMEGTSTDKIRAQCVKFSNKMRELATDASHFSESQSVHRQIVAAIVEKFSAI